MTNLSDEVTDKTEAADMVERVSAAIEKAGHEWLSEAGHDGTGWADVPTEAFSRAAIEAMLEPTTQMLFEGVIVQDSEDPAVQGIYEAMIQAALRPTSTRT